ncbi:MAG: deoxyribodipyrimidine photo-lyase [Pseudomonadaceae bacterium]|nr:deoxyribodipyrimidine photo-lyase [Pseudomonadaceae bacterium]
MTTLVWFRNDLRLADNPALAWACARGEVVPMYVLDEVNVGHWPLGGAGKWWLHYSLKEFAQNLAGIILKRGDAREIIPALAQETGATAVCWNRRYDPAGIACDRDLKELLRGMDIEVASHKANLLFEPWDVQTGAGDDYKVFTPFWKACMDKAASIGTPLPAPKVQVPAKLPASDKLDDWGLLPTKPNWAAGWENLWQPGEQGAQIRLQAFLQEGLHGYAAGRDMPAHNHTSRLSPHLHFGEISPRQVWHATQNAMSHDKALAKDGNKFLAEVGWREFCHHVLYHAPALPEENWRKQFDAYPWEDDRAALKAWQRGQTGYPFVDAGMRELWHTGTMHNRVRMVVASFLIKHLRTHWREGENWFWDTLLDADLANNAAGWQWVAGSGADGAPYFRIFNPITQGYKFDPDGVYTRRWLPELAKLPTQYLFSPWEAPAEVLAKAGVKLGETYPRPIVGHAQARAAALAGYEIVKTAKGD